jgi:hypothetical protein
MASRLKHLLVKSVYQLAGAWVISPFTSQSVSYMIDGLNINQCNKYKSTQTNAHYILMLSILCSSLLHASALLGHLQGDFLIKTLNHRYHIGKMVVVSCCGWLS